MRTYRVNEIFYSLQGEGVRAGTAALFLRLAGCNLHCTQATHGFDCDTDWRTGRPMTAGQIVQALRAASADCSWVVLTGGEPGLQADAALIEALHAAGLRLAVETNGTVALPPGFDWITVSPKVPEEQLAQRSADEVKYVMSAGMPLPQSTVRADHYLLSPAFRGGRIDPDALAWCIRLVREHPRWRLSCQLHRFWNIP